MRQSTPLAYRRTLQMIRALQRQPLDRDELKRWVMRAEGEDAYGDGVASAVERDLRRAREEFGVEIRYDHSARYYRLAGFGELGWLDLSDQTLEALAIVYRTFDDDAPESDRVRHALDELLSRLPLERRSVFLKKRQAFEVELRGLDRALAPQVMRVVQDAVARRVVLRFFHASPRSPHAEAIQYEVEPIELRHGEGHWYLRAFVRWFNAGAGRRHLEKERRFRLSYLLPDGLEVTSEKLPLTPRRRRAFQLRYLLHPDIARGDISHRFDDTEVTLRDDGWAEVTATAYDEFHVAQTLFRYADKCIVLAPEAVVERVRGWLWGMLEHYAPPE